MKITTSMFPKIPSASYLNYCLNDNDPQFLLNAISSYTADPYFELNDEERGKIIKYHNAEKLTLTEFNKILKDANIRIRVFKNHFPTFYDDAFMAFSKNHTKEGVNKLNELYCLDNQISPIEYKGTTCVSINVFQENMNINDFFKLLNSIGNKVHGKFDHKISYDIVLKKIMELEAPTRQPLREQEKNE